MRDITLGEALAEVADLCPQRVALVAGVADPALRSTLVLVEAFEAGLVLELMEAYRASAMLGVPTMLIALIEHPSVGDVAVVGLPSERMGEEVGAFLRAAPGHSIDREALFTYLRQHLSPQKTPRYWFVVDEYPMTGSGKIQKFALRQQWQEGKFSEIQSE